jgi:tagatose-6-phosphate ketose/aldose isomerase
MVQIFGYDEAELKNINAYVTAKEIMQQPKIWRETLEVIKKDKEVVEKFINELLTKNNLRIIFTGAGSSAFVGDSVVPYLNKKIGQKVEAIATTDIITNPENYLHPDVPTLLISCARSGNSPESLATVELTKNLVEDLYHIVLTCNPEGGLAQAASRDEKTLLLLMPEDSHDQGFAMTGSFTSMVLASLLIFDLNNLGKIEPDVEIIADLGERTLEEKIDQIKDIVSNDFNRAIFLGSCSLKGLARESALKTLELTGGRVMTNYDSSLGFRHGPKSVVDDRTLVFSYLSNNKHARQYEVDLIKEMAYENRNNKIIAVSDCPDREVENLADYFIYIADEKREYKDDVYLLFNYILNAQMFSLFKSIQLGVSPDNPSPDGVVNRVVKGVKIYPYTI